MKRTCRRGRCLTVRTRYEDALVTCLKRSTPFAPLFLRLRLSLLNTNSLPSAQALTDKPSSYPCSYPGCTYTSARPYDTNRHSKTHIPDTVSRLDCPYAGDNFCDRKGERGFTRADHREEHVRNVHSSRYPQRGFTKEDHREEHVRSVHPPEKRTSKE